MVPSLTSIRYFCHKLISVHIPVSDRFQDDQLQNSFFKLWIHLIPPLLLYYTHYYTLSSTKNILIADGIRRPLCF